MKTILYRPGTKVTCVINEGIENLLTINKEYEVTDSQFNRAIGNFTVTVIADNGLYYTFHERVFMDLSVPVDNTLTSRELEVYKRDPQVFIQNLEQIVQHGTDTFSYDIVIHYMEFYLNEVKMKRANFMSMFGTKKF